MEPIEGKNPTGEEKSTNPSGQKSNLSAPRLAANRKNALKAGRPRGSGVMLVDWAKADRLALNGGSLEAVAQALGVSRRTLRRRLADRRAEESPI